MRFLIPLLLACTANATDIFDIRVDKVVDGVYVASRAEPLRPYVEGNVTIIINEHDVVLVDAGGSPRAARNVIAAIRKLTPNPVRHLIYTHIHRDHRFGTQEYVKEWPSLEIIAHPIAHDIIAKDPGTFVKSRIERLEANRKEFPKEIAKHRASGNQEMAALLQRYVDEDVDAIIEEYRGIRNIAPTATFDQRLTLHRGKRTIDIRFLGRGDTDHDTIVHLPQDKVVVAGDMVVHPIPFGFSTTPDEWVATMGKLAELDFDYLVPGHGDVQRGKTYLRRLIELVKAARQPNADLSAFEKELAGDDPVLRHYFHENFATPMQATANK